MEYANDLKSLKKSLAAGELEFFNKYEPSIKTLLINLRKKGAIKTNFDSSVVETLKEIRRMTNVSAFLFQNVLSFMNLEESEGKKFLEYLKNKGFEIQDVADQMLLIICNNYHTTIEDLKIHLELCFDFDLICDRLEQKIPRFKNFSWLVRTLKDFNGESNEFLDYLNSGTRNSIVHRTYYYKNGLIYLYDGIFDDNPHTMVLSDFMIESKNFNILSLGFFHIFIELFKKPI